MQQPETKGRRPFGIPLVPKGFKAKKSARFGNILNACYREINRRGL